MTLKEIRQRKLRDKDPDTSRARRKEQRRYLRLLKRIEELAR